LSNFGRSFQLFGHYFGFFNGFISTMYVSDLN